MTNATGGAARKKLTDAMKGGGANGGGRLGQMRHGGFLGGNGMPAGAPNVMIKTPRNEGDDGKNALLAAIDRRQKK